MHSTNKKEIRSMPSNKKKYFKKFLKLFIFTFIFFIVSLLLFAFLYLFIKDRNLKKIKQTSILNGLTLQELGDKKSQINKKIESLSEQVEQNKKNFEKYHLENKMLKEKNNCLRKIIEIETEITKTEEEITKTEQEITDTENQIKIIEADIKDLERQKIEAQNNLSTINSTLTELKTQKENIERDIKNTKKEITDTKDQNTAIEKDIETYRTKEIEAQKKLDTKNEKLGTLTTNKEQTEKEIKDIENKMHIIKTNVITYSESRRNTEEQNNNKLSTLQQKLDELKTKKSNTEKDIQDTQTEINNMTHNKDLIIQTNIALQRTKTENNSILGQLQRKLIEELNTTQDNIQTKITNIEKKIQTIKTTIATLESKKTEAQNNLNKKNNKLTELKTKKTNLENTLSDLNAKNVIESKYLNFFHNMKQYLKENNFNVEQYDEAIYEILILFLSDSKRLESESILEINDLYFKLFETAFLEKQKNLLNLYEELQKLKLQQEKKINFGNIEYETLEAERYKIRNFIIRIDMNLNSLEYYFQCYHDAIQKILDKKHQLYLFVNHKNNVFDRLNYYFNIFGESIKQSSFPKSIEDITNFDIKKFIKKIIKKIISFQNIEEITNSLQEISVGDEIKPEDFKLENYDHNNNQVQELNNKNKAQVQKIDSVFTLGMYNKESKETE